MRWVGVRRVLLRHNLGLVLRRRPPESRRVHRQLERLSAGELHLRLRASPFPRASTVAFSGAIPDSYTYPGAGAIPCSYTSHMQRA